MKIIFGRTYDKMDLSIRIRVIYVGSILGRKGMRAIFQKKGKKRAKKEKIFENLDKNVRNLKIFGKRVASCVRLSHA